jgi:hypothetical protein
MKEPNASLGYFELGVTITPTHFILEITYYLLTLTEIINYNFYINTCSRLCRQTLIDMQIPWFQRFIFPLPFPGKIIKINIWNQGNRQTV